MRKRRKPRVVWLPSTNANSLGAAGTSNYQHIVVNTNGNIGDFGVAEVPVVIDAEGQDPLSTAETTLADIYDSGYRLRRIVGKVFAHYHQSADPNPPSVVLTCSLIVRRSDPETGTSLALLTGNGELLSPGEIRNINDPWIWRRSWILTNALSQSISGATTFGQAGNANNFGVRVGSALDGPHIDQKTARVVGPEERLFFNASLTCLEDGTDPEVQARVDILTDFRVLASMKTSLGNRNNASR